MTTNKYATRVHSWSEAETHSCIYLVGDPKAKPVISGLRNVIADRLCAVLNVSRDPDVDHADLGAAFIEFETECFGRNTYSPPELSGTNTERPEHG